MNAPLSIAEAQKGTALAPPSRATEVGFSNADNFELLQRIGTMFSKSLLVPKTFQGPQGVADCVIAVNMAHRMGADPLMVLQNLYVVHGKPAWSGQFVIAAINQSGRFVEPIHFEFVGTEGQDDWGCYVEAVTKQGTVIKGPTVTIAMAKAEGWHGKNPKWRNMPELMLRYRAGAFFGKTECPELLMGFKTEDEVRDIIDIDVQGNVINQASAITPASVGGATVVDDDPEGTVPWGAGTEEQEEEGKRCAAEVKEHGFYTKNVDDAIEWFNAAGQRWDAEQHALGASTHEPVVNKDGSFKAKRVYKDATPAEEAKPAPTPAEEAQPASALSEAAGYGLD